MRSVLVTSKRSCGKEDCTLIIPPAIGGSSTTPQHWRSAAASTSKLPMTPGAPMRPLSRSKNLDVPLPCCGLRRQHARVPPEPDARCRSDQRLFLQNAWLAAPHTVPPLVITVDKNAAYPKAN